MMHAFLGQVWWLDFQAKRFLEGKTMTVGEVCRMVRGYHRKNGYLPSLGMMQHYGVTEDEIKKLVAAKILSLHSLYAGGPLVKVDLTDTGMALAEVPG